MRRMEKITGRTDDMIILRGVNLFPTPDRGDRAAHPGPLAALRARADHAGAGWTTSSCRVEARPDCPAERRDAAAAAEVGQASRTPSGTSVEVLRRRPGDAAPGRSGKLQRLTDNRDRA